MKSTKNKKTLVHPDSDLFRQGWLSIHVMLTEHCNFKEMGCPCRYCYAPHNYLKNPTLKQFKIIIERCDSLGVELFYDLSGGNPLSRSDWCSVLRLFGRTGKQIYVNDNASLINSVAANKIFKLKEEFPGQFFWSLSLDDSNEKINNLTRSHYPEAVQGMKMLKEKGIDYRVAITLTSYNINTIEKTVKWIVRNLSKKIIVGVLRPVFPITSRSKKLFVDLEQVQDVHRRLTKLQQSGLDFEFFHTLRDADSRPFCEAGYERLAIKVNGDITPCYALQLEKDVLGNIYKLSNKGFCRLVEEMVSKHKKRDPEILLCEHQENFWGEPPVRLGK